MIGVVFKRAIEEYFSNIRVMLSYGILFLFVVFFVFFQQFFFNSGSVFLSFNVLNIFDVLGIVLVLIFLYVFSFFISLTVYSVHRDVQNVSLDTYWNALFKDAALKIFFLYLILAVVFYAISAIGFLYGVPFYALLINLIIGLVVMFAPQSIVLDGAGIKEGIGKSFEFWSSNFVTGIGIFAIATVLLFITLLIELGIDLIGLPGVIASFFIVLVVLVPFIEQAKSYAYLMKSDLLKSNEFVHANAPRIVRPKQLLGTRLREKPRHGNKL
ncbi:MAG: hypothetical protein WCI04_01515 [archaeon]